MCEQDYLMGDVVLPNVEVDVGGTDEVVVIELNDDVMIKCKLK